MPTYDYKCGECGHRFERLQRMSDAPVEVCPECGGTVKRLISAGAGLVFRGKGFHSTDYRDCCHSDGKHGSDVPPCGGGCSGGQCPL